MDFGDREQSEELHRLYWIEKKSLYKISRELEIPVSSLHGLFEKLGVRTRSKKKAAKLRWAKNIT